VEFINPLWVVRRAQRAFFVSKVMLIQSWRISVLGIPSRVP
jgi:hypothetical protein